MVYELKDQDVTPPSPDQINQRSVAADGLAAVAMVLASIGLIALVLSQVIN
jgi:predicted lipoprotein